MPVSHDGHPIATKLTGLIRISIHCTMFYLSDILKKLIINRV